MIIYRWWKRAKLLQYVNSQEEFEHYSWKYFKFCDKEQWIEYYWSTRKFLFLSRMSLYYYLFRMHFRFSYDFNFLVPGMEVKAACEEALNCGAELNFMGAEINKLTVQRL